MGEKKPKHDFPSRGLMSLASGTFFSEGSDGQSLMRMFHIPFLSLATGNRCLCRVFISLKGGRLAFVFLLAQ